MFFFSLFSFLYFIWTCEVNRNGKFVSCAKQLFIIFSFIWLWNEHSLELTSDRSLCEFYADWVLKWKLKLNPVKKRGNNKKLNNISFVVCPLTILLLKSCSAYTNETDGQESTREKERELHHRQLKAIRVMNDEVCAFWERLEGNHEAEAGSCTY